MPRKLPHGGDDANEGTAVIQYRGPESRVVAEPAGADDVRLVFATIQKFGGAYQKPYPVVANDAPPADTPDDAVLQVIADRLVETSPVLHYGAACPHVDPEDDAPCGEVFETMEGLAAHYGKMHGEPNTDGDDPELEQADADDGAGGDA